MKQTPDCHLEDIFSKYQANTEKILIQNKYVEIGVTTKK
jgi:hypothetical protein